MGEDLLIAVTGGNRPHIGCVSIGLPRPGLSGSSKTSSTVSTYNRVGHKDDVIGNRITAELCSSLNVPVVVACGIHIDNIQEHDFEVLQSLTSELICALKKAIAS